MTNDVSEGHEQARSEAPSTDRPADSQESQTVRESQSTAAPDPDSLTVPPESLHPRIRYLWAGTVALTAAFIGVLAVAINRFVVQALGPGLLFGAVAGTVLLLGIGHTIVRYRIWEYEIREDALYLRRGVLTRVRTVAPLIRIQHVDTSRGPIERLLGLSSVVVYTAGSRGADVTIPGLTVEQAEDMQRRLKRLAIAAGGDPAV